MTLDEMLGRLTNEIIIEESFYKRLNSGKKLRIKMGFDPTRPDLHLGHTIGLRLLKKLQEAGHKIIFLMGDYTVKIGDPSGRNVTRPMISDDEIKKNAATYFSQVDKILDMDDVEVRANSEWFGKFTFGDFLNLARQFTHAQIIERDDFQKRIKEGLDISFLELIYPVMQAYDSVMLNADIEVGGTDQKFNMLAGRSLQKKMGQPSQEIITLNLLVGTDGVNKMSKSLDNYIALNDSPKNMYGKIMSIPDKMIGSYFSLCTDVSEKALKVIEKELENASRNPRDIKAELAYLIVEMYHGEESAEDAQEEFDHEISHRELPEDIMEKEVKEAKIKVDDLLILLNLVSSRSEGRRLIEQGGVEIDKVKITDPVKEVELSSGMIIRAGKRKYVKIKK